MGANDPNKAELLEGADIYWKLVGDAAAVPTTVTAPWAAGWKQCGLLGEDGITEKRSNDESDHYALGGILVRTSRKNYKTMFDFIMLELSDETRPLVYPGSTATAIYDGVKPAKIVLGVEFRDGLNIERLISTNYAQVNVTGDITHNDSELRMYNASATVYPTGAGQIWTRVSGVVPSP